MSMLTLFWCFGIVIDLTGEWPCGSLFGTKKNLQNDKNNPAIILPTCSKTFMSLHGAYYSTWRIYEHTGRYGTAVTMRKTSTTHSSINNSVQCNALNYWLMCWCQLRREQEYRETTTRGEDKRKASEKEQKRP
jgi:hypothetical protein